MTRIGLLIRLMYSLSVKLVITSYSIHYTKLYEIFQDVNIKFIPGNCYGLIGAHIAPWDRGNRWNHEPKRDRKLLLHRGQIDQLLGRTKSKGLTLVPARWVAMRSP